MDTGRYRVRQSSRSTAEPAAELIVAFTAIDRDWNRVTIEESQQVTPTVHRGFDTVTRPCHCQQR